MDITTGADGIMAGMEGEELMGLGIEIFGTIGFCWKLAFPAEDTGAFLMCF